ncbi:MAG: amidohydrolase family protein [Sphingorhabdus sp.]
MPALPYRVYDADNHLYEPEEAFTRHLPKKWHREFQFVQVRGRTKLAIGGQISDYIPNPTFDVIAAPGTHEKWYRGTNIEGLTLREMSGEPVPCIPSYRNGEERLKLLDEQNIHATLMFPTLASVVEERMSYDLEMMSGVMKSLNRWTEEEWGFAREGRLFAIPMITLADLDLAIEELEWALSKGARAIGIRPAPVPHYRGSRSFGFKEFDPFWARVAEAGIFVCLHSSDSGYDKIARMWVSGSEYLPFQPDPFKACLRVTERAISDSISALICHGVFERHPNVRVVSVENGSSWVAPLLHTLELVYGQMPQMFKTHPVEQFRKHVFVAPYYEEDVPELARAIGVERVLYGSDYPHPEGLADPLSFIDEIATMSAADQERIMATNLKDLLAGNRD